MKISIGTKIQDGPWGGGNLFAINFSNYLIQNGHNVVFDLNDSDIDIILLTEPRKTSPSSSFTNYDISNYLKYVNSNALVVHRVNECDEHKDSKYINKYISFANQIADATIFVSTWIKNIYMNYGNFLQKPNYVILAGANENIFNRNNFIEWNRKEKIKLTTHHWSRNWKKGFEIYKEIDNLLSKNEYGKRIEFNFIGRLPEKLQFYNSNIIKPLSGIYLASEIKKNHLYITGSINEPSGNHHIEAAQCGLPVMYLDSGGIKEYCDGYGVEYQKDNLVEQIEFCIENYENLIEIQKSYPRNATKMSIDFLNFFNLILSQRDKLINSRIPQKPTYFKDFIYNLKKI